MLETHPFDPFIPKNARYLVLGSFIAKIPTNDPSYDWYYGSKRNQFWSIIELAYKLKFYSTLDKKNFLTTLRIALSDIIYQCERKNNSSLDSNLINCVYNIPIVTNILYTNKIEKIFFTSRFVEKKFKKHFRSLTDEFPNIELITLPSPSPRYTKMTKQEKAKIYRRQLPSLGATN